MHQPVVSLIAVGPDETVPHGIPWESVHLPSFNTDEVLTWIAEHDTGPVFIMSGMELAGAPPRSPCGCTAWRRRPPPARPPSRHAC